MGADVVGWRDCTLQRELGPAGFLSKLKLRSYRKLVEERVSPDQREGIELVVRVDGRPERRMSYATIRREVEVFGEGVPDCQTCPLARGKPVGCYRTVSYPLDAAFERLVFDFFTSRVQQADSICDQLYRDVVSRVPRAGNGWYTQRGDAAGMLAELREPLSFAWQDRDGDHRLDSAMLCASLFVSLDQSALVVAYALFFSSFLEFVDARFRRLGGDFVTIDANGEFMLKVSAAQLRSRQQDLEHPFDGEGDALMDELMSMMRSRTIEEVRGIEGLLSATFEGAVTEGWSVVVDA